jgi:hypothetical protein
MSTTSSHMLRQLIKEVLYSRQKMIHEIRHMGDDVMDITLTEMTKLPKEYFAAIDSAVKGSRFWEKPNTLDDIDITESPSGNTLATPSAEVLQHALQSIFQKLGLDIDVVVGSHDTDDIDGMTIHPEHPAYPNRWLVDAKWYISKQRPGRNTVDLEMLTAEEEIPDLDSAALVRHISQTVRHELVHYNQMKKQAKNKGVSDIVAFEEMLDDPKQVPSAETGTMADYLHSHIEIDAHAHDAAEELLAVYGEDNAMEQLRTGFNMSDPKLPNAVMHYYNVLPASDPTLNKLKGKMYSYMVHFLKN